MVKSTFVEGATSQCGVEKPPAFLDVFDDPI